MRITGCDFVRMPYRHQALSSTLPRTGTVSRHLHPEVLILNHALVAHGRNCATFYESLILQLARSELGCLGLVQLDQLAHRQIVHNIL